jgi:Glu-tRNA(Gln) amidotransferase subunit E-like FAD-binding protein
MASFFTGFIKHLHRQGYQLPNPVDAFWKEFIDRYADKDLYKEALIAITKRTIIQDEELEDVVNPMKPMSAEETDMLIQDLLDTNQNIVYKHPEKKIDYLMGQIMYINGGVINPAIVKEKLISKLEEKYV